MRFALLVLLAAAVSPYAFAATAEQWRGRSIYQYVHAPLPPAILLYLTPFFKDHR